MNSNLQINLKPPFQRNSVWSAKDRRFFLDTIFRGYPVPAIYINKETGDDGKSMYHIIDGKQRLETIFLFVKGKIKIDQKFGNSDLNGKKWSQIKKNKELAQLFWDYNIPVEYIKIPDKETSINEIFDRLNRNAKTLKEQELRHAKYDGWFITFIETEADNDEWRHLQISTKSKRKRMRDIQFLAELFMVTIANKVFGFDQEEISNYHATYDDPDENLEDFFDTILYEEKFRATRQLIYTMNKTNNCITDFAKDFKDFYTLWCTISINNLYEVGCDTLASRYREFMDMVFKTKEVFLSSAQLSAPNELVLKYYQNSIGAITESPQRIARHEALRDYLTTSTT